MATPNEPSTGMNPAAANNRVRGILVIAAAVLLGVVLMQVALGDDTGDGTDTATDSTVAAQEGGDTTEGETDTTVPDAVTTTTAAVAVRDPGEVAVLVLNGTAGPQAGVAGAGTDKLKTLNYITREPGNAEPRGDGFPSAIYFSEGFEAEAKVLATTLGVGVELVQPLDPSTVPTDDTRSANIVLLIGNDGLIAV